MDNIYIYKPIHEYITCCGVIRCWVRWLKWFENKLRFDKTILHSDIFLYSELRKYIIILGDDLANGLMNLY